MQVVIELSDETYKDIKEENGIYGINYGLSVRITGKVVGAIQSGTPLPKESIPYLMHKEMGVPLLECQKAYDVAIEYLRNKARVKG